MHMMAWRHLYFMLLVTNKAFHGRMRKIVWKKTAPNKRKHNFNSNKQKESLSLSFYKDSQIIQWPLTCRGRWWQRTTNTIWRWCKDRRRNLHRKWRHWLSVEWPGQCKRRGTKMRPVGQNNTTDTGDSCTDKSPLSSDSSEIKPVQTTTNMSSVFCAEGMGG